MARARKKAQTGDRSITVGAIKALWDKEYIQKWRHLLQNICPDGQWTANGNVSIKGLCPYHDERTPSFTLHFDKKIGKCFGCGKVVTDLVALYARAAKMSYTEALVDLADQFDLPELMGPGIDNLVEFNAIQEMKKSAASATREVIDEYLRDKPSYLSYLAPAIAYLNRGRGIPLNLLGQKPMLPVGVWAKPEHLKKYIPAEYGKLFDKYFASVNNKTWWGTICFNYNIQPGVISRFKFRKILRESLDACMPYERMQDIPEDVARGFADKTFHVVDDQFIPDMGVFGLHFYNRMVGVSEANAYLTEGEFDALSVMVAQLVNSRTDFMIFASGGTGNSGLSFLRELGVRTLWMVQDSPLKNGERYARAILHKSENFIGDSQNKALSYKVFRWNPEIRGEDLDEAIHCMGYQRMASYLYDERSSSFLSSYGWVLEKCDAEVAKITAERDAILPGKSSPAEKESVESDAREKIVAAVLKWIGCIHSEMEQHSFVQRYADREHIPLQKLSQIKSAFYSLNSSEGATLRIESALSEYITFAYSMEGQNGPQYMVWAKQRHTCYPVSMNPNSIAMLFSQCIGCDVIAWAKNLLEGSSLFEDGKCKPGTFAYDRKVEKNIQQILGSIIRKLGPASRDFKDMVGVGQGIHYKDLGDDPKCVYFVNGEKVFRGRYIDGGSASMDWEFVNNTVDAQYYFQLDMKKKWSVVDDEAELYTSASIDLMALYNDLRKILDGWKFEHHELTRDYLAAWIMSLPIQKALSQVNITFITGATTSGKTSFIRGLLGGNLNKVNFEVPSVIEGSWFSSDATPAGIYQEMDNSALTLCLDEAEARQNSDHSGRVSAFQELAFSIPFGGATMSRGGATASGRASYTMQMPVVMAAINMAANPTFLNRVVPVYTEKDINRKNVGVYIWDNFTTQDIERIRKNVTLAFLDKLPKLFSRIGELRRHLSEIHTSVKVSDRYITIYLPALLIIDYLGMDACEMFRQIVEHNSALIENLNGQDFHSDLLNAVLYTPAIRATPTEGANSILVSAQYMIQSGDIVALNKSGCGVAILPGKGWIVIFWRDAKYSLLKQSEYRYTDEASLRESVAKNRYLIHGLTKEDHRYIVKTLGRTDIKTQTQYSVIHAGFILSEEQVKLMKQGALEKKKGEGPMPLDASVEAYDFDATPVKSGESVAGGNFTL